VIKAPLIRITNDISIEKSKTLNNVPWDGLRRAVAMRKGRRLRTTDGWCILDDDFLPSSKEAAKQAEFVTLSCLVVLGHEINGETAGAWCVVISPENASLRIYKRVGLGYVGDKELIASAMAGPETITLV
jgi:hypothetical protein